MDDGGPPAQTGQVTFTVVVSDYVEPGFGSTVLLAGQHGSVPLSVFSSIGLTNLNLTLLVPSNRFAGFTVSNLAPEILTGVVQPLSAAEAMLRFTNHAGQSLTGAVQVATLHFDTLSNQPSAFVPLRATNLLAVKGDGGVLTNLNLRPGRVVIINQESLLEAVLTGTRPDLILYGRPGLSYQVEWTTDLFATNGWQNGPRLPMTNLVYLIPGITVPPPGIFYRAHDFVTDPPELELSPANGTLSLLMYGRPSQQYQFQSSTNLSGGSWLTRETFGLTNSFRLWEINAATNQAEFFRTIRQ